MTGYDKNPTDIIQDMFAHRRSEKINALIDMVLLNRRKYEDFNATGNEEIDDFTIYFRLKIMFDSDKFSTEEHKMFIEFSEFIDQHFDELKKILQQQFGNVFTKEIDQIISEFLTATMTRELKTLQEAAAENKDTYIRARKEFIRFLYS